MARRKRPPAQEPDEDEWEFKSVEDVLETGWIALGALQPEAWERGALEWAAKRIRAIERFTRTIFLGVGLLFLAFGGLLASLYFPAVRLTMLFITAGIAAVLGLWIMAWGLRLSSRLRRRRRSLQYMAEMSNVERHAHVARRVKERHQARRARDAPRQPPE